MLIKYPLPSRSNKLLAMSKLRLRAAVGLLTGHTTLRVHLYKLGHTQRQECRLCEHDKEDSVHIVTVLSWLVKDTGSGAVFS
jgi:hypothetical protein